MASYLGGRVCPTAPRELRMGVRFGLHARKLPGKPDLVLPRLKKIIEVRGCFWHQHPGCIDSHIPKSRTLYLKPKLASNRRRDSENERKLRELGWRVLVLWECEPKDSEKLSKRIGRFFAM